MRVPTPMAVPAKARGNTSASEVTSCPAHPSPPTVATASDTTVSSVTIHDCGPAAPSATAACYALLFDVPPCRNSTTSPSAMM